MEQRDAMIGENANTDRWLVGPARESRVVFLRTVLRMDLYSGNLYLLRLQVHKKCEKGLKTNIPVQNGRAQAVLWCQALGELGSISGGPAHTGTLQEYPVCMFVSKAINKECLTKVKYIATRPILWCRRPEFRKEMDTTVYICKWNDTANTSTILVLKGRNFV